MSLFRGLRRDEMSISICDHCSGAKGGVRDDSGIQCTDETSDSSRQMGPPTIPRARLTAWSSGSGLNGDVCKKTAPVSPWLRAMCGGSRLTKGTQNHQQPLAQTRGDLPLIQPANLHKLLLRQIDTYLFPCLAIGGVQRRLVRRLVPAAGERNVR